VALIQAMHRLIKLFQLDHAYPDSGIFRIANTRNTKLAELFSKDYPPNSSMLLSRFFSRYYDSGVFLQVRSYSDSERSIRDRADEIRLLWPDRDRHYTPLNLETKLATQEKKDLIDFFIHKNLKEYLNRELDNFISDEIIRVNGLARRPIRLLQKNLLVARSFRENASKIIDILAECENTLKHLLFRKKFVLETHYCMTLDRVPKGFYREIAANKKQWEEWERLLDMGISKLPAGMGGMGKGNAGVGERLEYMHAHPELPLDTAHFTAGFRERLLSKFDDLDAKLDGVLIHGDNFHGLRLLQTRFKEEVQCIYIDPPFNTGAAGHAYKDEYQRSAWLSFMADRIEQSVPLLKADGTFYAHIDYSEKERLRLILDEHLCYMTEIIWRIGWLSGFKTMAKKFIRNHDTIYQYGKTQSPLFIKSYIPYPEGYVRRDGSPPKGKGYPLEDTWNCSEIDQLNSIQIISFSKEKAGSQALTQKNENLLERIIMSSSLKGQWVMDFFCGSGTTCAAAHKMGRKWIGIESGSQFDEYALPRMKKVLFGDRFGISAKYKWRGGGMFKYIRLESFEAALENSSRTGAIGIDRYADADVVETLIWLLGLVVNKMYVKNDFRIVEGKDGGGKKILVVWRKYSNEIANDPLKFNEMHENASCEITSFLNDRRYNSAWDFDAVYTNVYDKDPPFYSIEKALEKLMSGQE
jgi:DNA modification methylase